MTVSLRRSSVDRRIGADLHIVLHDHASQLRNAQEPGLRGSEAEALLPDPGARIDVDARTQKRVAQAGMRSDPAIGADGHALTDRHERTNPTTRADFSARLDDNIGTDLRRRIDVCCIGDNGRAMDARASGGMGWNSAATRAHPSYAAVVTIGMVAGGTRSSISGCTITAPAMVCSSAVA